jgi:hypothetical protein
LELPLRTTATDERALSIRLDAARNIYNACLGEALWRQDRMRKSKAWQAGRKLPKRPPGSQERKASAKAFKEISAEYGKSSWSRKAPHLYVGRFDRLMPGEAFTIFPPAIVAAPRRAPHQGQLRGR